MIRRCRARGRTAVVVLAAGVLGAISWHRAAVWAQQPPNSYAPVAITEEFDKTVARMSAAKPAIMKRQAELLEERYDLSDRPAKGVTMDRRKPVQEGVRVKLPQGVASWQDLAAMSPEEIRAKGLWPQGFLPLPHPNHPEGGMVFPKEQIDEIKKQEGRDLTRFDLDFDLPAHLMPEYPPAIYLTTRPDLGDVSQGKVVAIKGEGVTDSLAGAVIAVELVVAEAYHRAKQTQPRAALIPQRAKRGTRLKLFHIKDAILDVKRRADIVHLELRLRSCEFLLEGAQDRVRRGFPGRRVFFLRAYGKGSREEEHGHRCNPYVGTQRSKPHQRTSPLGLDDAALAVEFSNPGGGRTGGRSREATRF